MRQARLVAAKTTGEDVQTDFTASTAVGASHHESSAAIGIGVCSTAAVNALRIKKTQVWARLAGFPHWPGTQFYTLDNTQLHTL